METNDHFIFSEKNNYYFLTVEETYTLAKRGLEKQPLNLGDFSQPVGRADIYSFVHHKTQPISLDGNKIHTDTFWQLIIELLRDYN